MSLPKCNIKAQRVCGRGNNSSVGPEETRHEGKGARCTAGTSQRVFLLFVPLMPHNPGQSGPFWACFQKKDLVSVVLNSVYTLTSHEGFGKITIETAELGLVCASGQDWGGGASNQYFLKAPEGPPQLRRAHLKGSKAFSPSMVRVRSGRGPKPEHAAF